MFQTDGICWHTGYKPKEYVSPPRVPRAVIRMKRYLELLREVKKDGN